jgi:predicted signal transduction protein with EAL and GGDEF domain
VVLRRVAVQLVNVLRPMDTVARIGGDEFVVLAPDVASHLHAVDIGNRIVAELCRRPDAADGERITASIGVSVSLDGRGTAEGMINEADMAMYEAKSLGGARAEAFDAALGVQVQQRAVAQQKLQSALDDHRIVVHYQPVIDLDDGGVAGFEALARITDTDGSILPPASFIPVAEDSGLVVPLGSHVMAIACDEAVGWQPEYPAPRDRRFTVAVNLSSRQFLPGDLPAIVRQELTRSGLPPDCLHLELTETAIIELRPDILQQLHDIRDLGVEIGLDDFGTGYASLTHLRRLPLSFVKIDQSFVKGLGTEDGDERIVAAVIDLADNLGLRSVAEGVEVDAQLERLCELGCNQAQGFLFDRPLPPSEVDEAMHRRAW